MRRTIARHAHTLQWSTVDSATLRPPVSKGDAFDVTLQAVWAASRNGTQAVVDGKQRQRGPTPPPLLAGYCGVTAVGEGTHCKDTDSKGSWLAGGLFDCMAACRQCERCHYISYSELDHDCSWFLSCPLALGKRALRAGSGSTKGGAPPNPRALRPRCLTTLATARGACVTRTARSWR